MPKPIYKFTKEGFLNLKKEQENLTSKRPEVLKRMVAAREQGDLSENAGYHAAKEELGQIDSRLRELKMLLRFGEVVEDSSTSVVGFGTKVKVDDGSSQAEFTIVSGMEADPVKGKMSDESPIGGALLGKRVGDEIEVEVPSGRVVYKILEIGGSDKS